MSFDEYQENRFLFNDILIDEKNWLSNFRSDIAMNDYDGWFNPLPFELVKSRQRHEIASHGFSHLPLGENLISEEDFLLEMSSVSKLSELKSSSFKTFVYPRNIVGYPHLLGASGFIGYRDSLYDEGIKLKRIREWFSELNIMQSAQAHGRTEQNIVKIPPAYFLNWRANLRKRIPLSVTVHRWHNIIKKGIENSGVIHLTSHPQDFIAGNDQYHLFDEILKFIVNKQMNGEILNLTLSEYSNNIVREIHKRKAGGACY
jgi:hypothetical protein